MKNLKFLKPLLLTAIFAIFATSCDDDDDNNNDDSGTSRVRISMTDAPGDYDKVNVEVIGVKYKATTDTGENGWIDIPGAATGVYDLLDLTGGVTVMLADAEVPSGHLGQIRLMLGDENTVVKDGITYELHTPSAQQSGLKVNIDQELEADMTYNFLIDFDVHNSVVVEAGNSGNYNLHPVLHVTTEASSGSISGTILNIGVPVEASVMVNGTQINANTDADGHFVIHGIPAGTYTVTLTPGVASGLAAITVENVTVVNGQATAIGDITI